MFAYNNGIQNSTQHGKSGLGPRRMGLNGHGNTGAAKSYRHVIYWACVVRRSAGLCFVL